MPKSLAWLLMCVMLAQSTHISYQTECFVQTIKCVSKKIGLELYLWQYFNFLTRKPIQMVQITYIWLNEDISNQNYLLCEFFLWNGQKISWWKSCSFFGTSSLNLLVSISCTVPCIETRLFGILPYKFVIFKCLKITINGTENLPFFHEFFKIVWNLSERVFATKYSVVLKLPAFKF